MSPECKGKEGPKIIPKYYKWINLEGFPKLMLKSMYTCAMMMFSLWL